MGLLTPGWDYEPGQITLIPDVDLPAGTRIRLIEMPNDPCPIEAGTTGTVRRTFPDPCHRGGWIVEVDWDVVRSLNLCIPPDRVEILNPPISQRLAALRRGLSGFDLDVSDGGGG